jgi:hypothetical protein
VTLENIHQIAEKFHISGLSDSEYQRLYKELDLNKDGQVTIEEFVSLFIDVSSAGRKSSFKDFFDKINQSFTSKSQTILEKLKILKNTAKLNKDNASLEHLEW